MKSAEKTALIINLLDVIHIILAQRKKPIDFGLIVATTPIDIIVPVPIPRVDSIIPVPAMEIIFIFSPV